MGGAEARARRRMDEEALWGGGWEMEVELTGADLMGSSSPATSRSSIFSMKLSSPVELELLGDAEFGASGVGVGVGVELRGRRRRRRPPCHPLSCLFLLSPTALSSTRRGLASGCL